MGDTIFPGDRSPFRTGFLRVSLFIDGAWVSVDMDELSDDGVQIKRGYSASGTRGEPSACTMRLKDPIGKWSPRNPQSVYYGKIGRGTLLKVETELEAGTVLQRWQGEVVSWQPGWTRTGSRDAYVDIEGSGVLRRLLQGRAPLVSPLRRAIEGIGADLVGYWPMEDATGSVSLAPAVGSAPLNIKGAPTLADSEAFAASDPIPTLGSGSFSAAVPAYTTTTPAAAAVRWIMRVPAGAPDGAVLLRVQSSGTMGRADVIYSTASGGSILLNIYNQDGTFNNNLFSPGGVNNANLRCSLEMTQSGANISADIVIYNVDTGTDLFNGALPFSALTLGRIDSVSVNPNRSALTDVAFGHLSIERVVTGLLSVSADVLASYRGERAQDRIVRLCGEQGLTAIAPFAAAAVKLGAQRTRDLPALLEEAAEADGGLLFDNRDTGDVAYVANENLWEARRSRTVTFPYEDNQLLPFEPVEDDAQIRNAVTVTRSDGGSATVRQDSGALGAAAVGLYDDAVTLNLFEQAQVRQHAAWRVAHGTHDEARWPAIGVDLADPRLSPSERATLQSIGIGYVLDVPISSLPTWLPRLPVRQMVVGYTERIAPLSYRIEWACVPASLFEVADYWDSISPTSRYDTDGCTLAEDLTFSETDVTVNVGRVAWGHDDGDYQVEIGGEHMTVTAVTAPAAGQQTLTVIRSANFVAKAHLTDAPVRLARRYRYGLQGD